MFTSEPNFQMWEQGFGWQTPSLINHPQRTQFVYKSYYWPYYKNPDEFEGPKPYYQIVLNNIHPTTFSPDVMTDGVEAFGDQKSSWTWILILVMIIFFIYLNL